MNETSQQVQVLPPEPAAPAQLVRQIRPVSDPVPMFDTAMFEHMQRIATVMAESTVIPDSLRKGKNASGQEVDLERHRVVANCFMVVNQAWRWKMDPFAVVQCASFVHGRLMWEGKLVAAVLDANLGVRLEFTFTNDTTPPAEKLGVIVSATIPGETKPRTIEGTVADWHKGPKSPWAHPGAWKRQLRYMGAREWARAHAPAIMLGVIADDEAEAFDDRQTTRSRPKPAITAAAAIAADIPEIMPDPVEEPAAAALAAAAKAGKPAAAPSAAPEPAKPAPAAQAPPIDDDDWPGPRK